MRHVEWSLAAEATWKKLSIGRLEGELKGRLEGELKGKRETLLRLLSRAGITLTDDEVARVKACEDPALLDRWVDNVLGAKIAGDVLS